MNPCLILLHLLGIPLRGRAIKRWRLNFKLYLSNLFEKRGLLGGNRLSRIRCGLGIPRSRLLPLDPPRSCCSFSSLWPFRPPRFAPRSMLASRAPFARLSCVPTHAFPCSRVPQPPLSPSPRWPFLGFSVKMSSSIFFSKNNIPPRILRLSYSRIFSRNSFSNHESILSFPEINSGARVEYSAEQYFWKRRNFDERSLRME